MSVQTLMEEMDNRDLDTTETPMGQIDTEQFMVEVVLQNNFDGPDYEKVKSLWDAFWSAVKEV